MVLPKDGWAQSYHAGIVSDGLGRVYFSNEWYQGTIYRWEAGKVVEHSFKLSKDGWAQSYHAGIVSDGLGRVYFSNEWYQGTIYRWEAGKVVEHSFKLSGYDHLSDAVPVPGTSHIYMIHCVSGRGRIDPCLLDLDMNTGRCRVAALPGIGEDVRCRWLTRDWLLLQAHGESRAYDSAQLINMTTREVLRIKPGMFGEDRFQHLGILLDGTVVIVVRRHLVGPVFLYPKDFWGFLRESSKKRQLEPWRDCQERYPNIPFVLPNRSSVKASSDEEGKESVISADWLTRSGFETLSDSDRVVLMERVAARFGFDFLGLETFKRWGQRCITGRFRKDGREFVFVPGDTVTLGWDCFAVGLDQDSRAELEYLFQEWETEQDPEEMIRESMAPVRQVAIAPMLVGRELEELCWEPVAMTDPRLTAHPEWLKKFREFAWSDLDSLTLHKSTRIERTEKGFRICIYNRTDYKELRARLVKQGLSLPTADEWAYLCGGGGRTLFPWGDGMDYSLHLHHFESLEDEDKPFDLEEPNFFGLSIAYDPYKREVVEAETLTTCGGDGGRNICGEDEDKPFDLEEPNFFGLSIAYDPYKREVVEAETLTTCGGDGGRNICGGLGPLLAYLPCSPHAKPNKHVSDELNGDFDFYRPIIRLNVNDLSASKTDDASKAWSAKYEAIKNKLVSTVDYEKYFTPVDSVHQNMALLAFGDIDCPTGRLVACDPCTAMENAKPFIQSIPAGRYPLTMAVSVSRNLGGDIDCPTGRLVACDPCTAMENAKPFIQSIPAGRYPLTMAVSVSRNLGSYYVCAKLSVSETKPVRYELGMCGGENLDALLKDDDFFGFSVDAGMATLTDEHTQKAFISYWKKREAEEEGIDPYNDLFADLLEENAGQYPQYQSSDGDWCAWTVPETNCRLVVFTSGLGDGVYPTYFGYDANGQVCGVYVPFIDLDQL